jgi:hypothetical protein
MSVSLIVGSAFCQSAPRFIQPWLATLAGDGRTVGSTFNITTISCQSPTRTAIAISAGQAPASLVPMVRVNRDLGFANRTPSDASEASSGVRLPSISLANALDKLT